MKLSAILTAAVLLYANSLLVQCLQSDSQSIGNLNWNLNATHATVFAFLNRTKLLEKVVEGDSSPMTCTACEFVIEIGTKVLFSTREFSDMFSAVCEIARIEVPHVCKGLSALYSPQLYYIFKNSKLSAKEMCALLLGPNCMPKLDYLKSRGFWHINVSSKKNPKTTNEASAYDGNHFKSGWIPGLPPPPLFRASVRRVLQLSDIHVDPNYSVGKYADCDEPLCCNDDSTRNSQSTISGFWGSYGKCDSPDHTVNAALSHVSQTQRFDYAMYTGDISPHRIWNITEAEVLENARSLTARFVRYFPKTKFFFPVIGNHESVPVNMFPPPEFQKEFSMQWLYDGLYNEWQRWIPKSGEKSFKFGGYFSQNVTRKLRVIVLNTNFCARLNFWQLMNPKDPGSQLQWLSNELQSAEDAQQSVHLIGHIAPDKWQCSAIWLHNYIRLLSRYNETIKAQFFGHTHFDEIRIYESSLTKQASSVAFIGGSLTTYENVNPMFRMYSLGDKSVVEDFETYYFNLTSANSKGSKAAIEWIKEYTAKQDYGMESLSPPQFDILLQRMKKNDTLFQKYYDHYTRKTDAANWPKVCDAKCKENLLNSIPVSDTI